MSQRVDVHIDVLRLPGQGGQPGSLPDEIRNELRRLLEVGGMPVSSGIHLDRVAASSQDGNEGSRPGTAVARALYRGMRSNETDTG